MICLSRDFNHLSAFSITNLSKQITFTPFVFISSHVLCFVLHLFNYVYLQKGCHSSAMWGFLLWFLSPLCDTLLHVQLFEGQCQTWDFFPFLLQLCLYHLPLLIQMMRMKMNLTIRMNQQKQMMTVAFIKTQEIHHHLTAHVMKNKPLYWDKNAWENAHRMKTAKVKRKNAYAMELAECRALNQVVQWNRKNMILFRAHEPSFLTFSME